MRLGHKNELRKIQLDRFEEAAHETETNDEVSFNKKRGTLVKPKPDAKKKTKEPRARA